jgi:hypothetical protein
MVTSQYFHWNKREINHLQRFAASTPGRSNQRSGFRQKAAFYSALDLGLSR